jgi:hypothetical protein
MQNGGFQNCCINSFSDGPNWSFYCPSFATLWPYSLVENTRETKEDYDVDSASKLAQLFLEKAEGTKATKVKTT